MSEQEDRAAHSARWRQIGALVKDLEGAEKELWLRETLRGLADGRTYTRDAFVQVRDEVRAMFDLIAVLRDALACAEMDVKAARMEAVTARGEACQLEAELAEYRPPRAHRPAWPQGGSTILLCDGEDLGLFTYDAVCAKWRLHRTNALTSKD
jgi:hypothetical protein